MLGEFSYKDSLFLPLDNNDYIDETSFNQITSQLFQKEFMIEDTKNNPYSFNNNTKTDFIDSEKNKIISNNNNYFKEEKWNNIFTKKEYINEEDIDPKNLYYIDNNKSEEKPKTEKILFFENNESLSQNITPKKNNKKNKKNINNNKSDNNNNIIKDDINNIKNTKNELILPNDISEKPTKGKRGPYKKKKLFSDLISFDDKCFPFKLGKGVININTKFNYDYQEDDNEDNKDLNSYELTDVKTNEELYSNLNVDKFNPISENDIYLMKFTTKKYYVSENGRRKRVKKKRKFKSDMIRKKIKSRFHKTLKYIINDNLKKAGSKMLFDCLPQCFIENISLSLNSKALELTYKELLLTDFGNELNSYRHTPGANEKFIKNLKVLEYLEQNPEISEKSGFNIIKNLKYKELLNNYFISTEFEQSLDQIKTEGESEDYLQSYIYRAKNYIKYYSNPDSTE